MSHLLFVGKNLEDDERVMNTVVEEGHDLKPHENSIEKLQFFHLTLKNRYDRKKNSKHSYQ